MRNIGPVALGAGVLAFCFPLFHWWPLVWFALAPLLVKTAGAPPRAAAGWFFFAGWLFHTLLLQWLMANVMWAGGWAVLGFQGLCLALAVFWAPVGYAWRWAGARLPGEAAALLLAALWGVLEWIHANAFTGFGWSALGYSQGPDLPFAQMAALGGVSLLSAIIVFVNALLALAWTSRAGRARRIALAACVLLVAHGAGWALLDESAPREDGLRVGIAQSNFPIELKYDADYTVEMVERSARESAAMAAAEPVHLMVWPEALVMDHFENPAVLAPMENFCTGSRTALFTGSIREEGGQGFNSSVLIGADGAIRDHYDKVHLVPFGEYVPLAFLFPFLKSVVPSNASSGGGHKLLAANTPPFGPMICFEVLYNGIAEDLHAQGAAFFTVITNLAWFGRSAAVPQELEIARFRAIETRVPLVHAANTGISGVFDPYGRFEHIHGYVRRDGSYVDLGADSFSAEDSLGQRMAGAFAIPAAGARPWSHGARYFTLNCLILSVGMIAWAARARR
jgi:apolipoprotein N-acyltransferase